MKQLFIKASLAIMLFILSTPAISQNKVDAIFGKGIKMTAADTSMSVKFQLRMQHLFEMQQDLGEDMFSEEGFESNYLVRRARLKFGGHVYSPKLKYKVELGLSNRDISTNKEDGNGRFGSRMILDAVLKYKFHSNWSIWVGQTKLPGNRERVISSANLQFVNRSNVNSKFNIDRDMGIQLHGKYGKSFVVKPKFAWTMGEGRNITEGNFGGYNYTGRIEFLPMGEFEGKKEDYNSSDLKRQSTPKLAVAGTYNFNDDAVRQQGQLGSFVYNQEFDAIANAFVNTDNYATADLASLQLDLMFKYKGISVMAEYANTQNMDQSTSDNVSKKFNTGQGLNLQMGYLFENNFEVAGRFTGIEPDDSNSGISKINEYTLGVSKYIVGHNLKIQSDFSYIDQFGNDGAVRFRFQVEMQF
ncbi:MAG: porin [Crocinitomicaceae bacterium]